MKVYYTHCMSIYGTPQEKRDVELLKRFGFEVVNPSDTEHRDSALAIRNSFIFPSQKDEASAAVMVYFTRLVQCCDILAFRALPDGAIPADVAGEIVSAGDGKPLIELPSSISRRILTVEQTREYLKEIGQR